MNLLDTHFEIKSVSESGIFCGMGSVYGVIDEGDDIVAPGAFADSLKSWGMKGRMPALLWQHNQREPIGAYTKMQETDGGLYVEGQLALKTQRGAEAYELMKMGALSGLSIGFMTQDDSYDQTNGVRTIKKGELMEVSIVTFPMNDAARIHSVKSIEQITDFKSAEAYLRESGLSRSAAIAIVGRIKTLIRSDSDAHDTKALMAALQRRSALFAQP